MNESDIPLFHRHLIGKLLVPINQSSYLTCFCYNKCVRNKIGETTFADNNLLYFSSFIFKKIIISLKNNPSEKNVTVEEELDCTDIDDIGNLEDDSRGVWESQNGL